MTPPDYIVSLSEQAFFTMIASALEAFKVRHAHAVGECEGDDHNVDGEDDEADEGEDGDADEDPDCSEIECRPVETCGNLWGYVARTKRKEQVLHISLADVDTSAERRPGEVTPQDEAFNLKADLVDHLRPELEYLGDFHTHPYHYLYDRDVKTVAQVERQRRYEFSPADFECARHLRKHRSYRVGLVATIYRGRRPGRKGNGYIGANDFSCIRFSYGDLTIWLKCYVFDPTRERRIRKDKIALLCPAIGFHASAID